MAIIQGEARVGKTSIKSLILGLPYSELSTSCIEAPCMAFGNFSISRYGRTDIYSKRWTPVTDDEMDDIVIAKLQEIASHYSEDATDIMQDLGLMIDSKTLEKSVRGEASEPLDLTQSSKAILASKAGQNINSKDSVPLVNLPTKDIEKPMQVELMHTEELVEDKRLQNDAFEFLEEECHATRYDFDRDWLYFFDSGGQIQFQKLLLAFMPCSSVLVLVVKLSKNLRAKSKPSMKIHGPDGKTDTIITDEYSLKVEDMLQQVLSAVSSNTRQFKLMMKDQPHINAKNEKLQVITIGTCRDKYEEKIKEGKIIEDTTKKSEILNSILKKSEYIHIKYKNDTNLLHEVDGRKAKLCGRKAELGESNDPVIETISEALKEQAYEIEVPFKWHYFGVLLRKKAKENDGILELSSCIGFGKSLGMSKDTVMSALQFFHALKLLFYYHDSPAKDIVFVKLDVLIEIIRKLMIKVCKSHVYRKTACKELVQLGEKGYLSSEYLKEHATGPLKEKEGILLDLFVHLKIAALIPTDEKDKDEKNKKPQNFFMPALLPVKDVSDVFTTPPLLYYFNDEPVPMGLFCAVIVQLLSYSGDEKWDIITEELNFSNFFTIQKKIDEDMCQVILVEQLYCIEVHCEERSSRQSVKGSILKAVDDVVKNKLLSDSVKPVSAFYCPCSDGRNHVATVKNDKFIICKNTGKNQKLLDLQCDEYWSWFMTEQKIKDIKCKRKKDNPSIKGEYRLCIILKLHDSYVTDTCTSACILKDIVSIY